MTTKHTPGPWSRIDNKVFALTPYFNETVGVPDEVNRFGCYIQRENREPYGAPDDELEANAHLIAAAPDLLEALEAFINCCDKAPPLDLITRIGEACVLAKVAVAKAKGGKP